jgi:hypothetical protein
MVLGVIDIPHHKHKIERQCEDYHESKNNPLKIHKLYLHGY